MPDGLSAENTTAIRGKIRDYLVRISRRPDLADDHDIFGSGVVNSLFAVEIVCFIEEAFDITVENNDLDIANFCSVDALTRLVARKSANA